MAIHIPEFLRPDTNLVEDFVQMQGFVLKKYVKQWIILSIVLALCGCGRTASEAVLDGIEEGIFSYNGQLYKNSGEIFLSEKEMEYVSLITEMPKEIKGAEEYIYLYQYFDWLLLGNSEKQYFLLAQNSDASDEGIGHNGNQSQEIASDAPPYIYYNHCLYRYGDDNVNEDIKDRMEVLGFIQSTVGGSNVPKENFQTNIDPLVGHLLYGYDDMLVISRNGGETYNLFVLEE